MPQKRPSIRSKTSSNSGSGLISRPPTHREGAVVSDSFINSKRDKRTIKHSAFVSRIEKAHTKPLKRRRPSKKLVTTLEGLADTLPELENGIGEMGKSVQDGGKMKLKGLKSRPGGDEKKEKLERMERERFGKNMAQLNSAVGVQGQQGKTAPGSMEVEREEKTETNAPATNATASRWAALRDS